MAIQSTHTRVLIDELDLSAMSNAATVDITSDNEDVTTFQASGRQMLTLDPALAISFGGYYTDANAGLEAILHDRLANSARVAIHFGTNGGGGIAYMLNDSNTANFSVTAPVPGVIAVEGSFITDTPNRVPVVGWGNVSALGGQPAQNVGAGAYNFLLIVHSADGAVSASIEVEESADGSTGWVSVVFLPNFSSAGEYSATGTANQPFLRANIVNLGGAASISYTLLATPA